MKIRNFEIGQGRTFIIAETCSNIIQHIDSLKSLVSAVAETGADALKVQLYLAEHFPTLERGLKKKTEFPRDRFAELVELCHKCNLACGTSVFDEEAVEIAQRGDFLKIATREEHNFDLVYSCLMTPIPVIQSYDWRDKYGHLNGDNFLWMECVPEYPAHSFKIRSLTGLGWSSHTANDLDVLMAVTRGAVVIEKHIKFSADDYEAGWSLYPDEFKTMVERIRWVEAAR